MLFVIVKQGSYLPNIYKQNDIYINLLESM